MNEIRAIEKHKSGFEFDEVQTVRGRNRYLIESEIVGLQCSTCKEAFDLDNFYYCKKGTAEKQPHCKSCSRERASKWNKENKARYNEKNNNWLKTNKELSLAIVHNTRARLNGQLGNLAEVDIKILFRKATENGKLVDMVTGELVEKPVLAHITKVEEAGSSLGNLIIVSQSVNTLQGSQNLFEFLLAEKGQKIADKETIQYTLHWLASSSVEEYLSQHLNEKEVKKFIELYY